jgi:hypothetical protein
LFFLFAFLSAGRYNSDPNKAAVIFLPLLLDFEYDPADKPQGFRKVENAKGFWVYVEVNNLLNSRSPPVHPVGK